MNHKSPKNYNGFPAAKPDRDLKIDRTSEVDDRPLNHGIPRAIEDAAQQLDALLEKIVLLANRLTPVSKGDLKEPVGEIPALVSTSPVQAQIGKIYDGIAVANLRISKIIETLDI